MKITLKLVPASHVFLLNKVILNWRLLHSRAFSSNNQTMLMHTGTWQAFRKRLGVKKKLAIIFIDFLHWHLRVRGPVWHANNFRNTR